MRACETHEHGKYVTFVSNTGVYHLSNSDFEHTFCGIGISHPYRLPDGFVVDHWPGYTSFQSFNQSIPEGERLCAHCQRQRTKRDKVSA